MRTTLLLAHGSRDPAWRDCVDKVAQRARELDPLAVLRCAFLERMQPDLASATAELVALGATEIVIIPLFFGMGKHAREDIPNLVAQLSTTYPGTRFLKKLSTGEEPQVIDLLAKMALSPP